MDFAVSEEERGFRQEVSHFLDHELTSDIVAEFEERGLPGPLYYRQLNPKLGARGWLGLGWPRHYGGEDSIAKQFIVAEEATYRGVAFRNLGVSMVAPNLLIYGSQEQKRYFLPAIGRGELVFCALFSEPDAGSDSAAIGSSARSDGDDYVISGQKLFASEADLADYALLTARTNPEAPKHRGISMFLLDMRSPGITVRPLITMAGDRRFNEVFLDEVRLPQGNLFGEKDRGWYQLMTLFDYERAAVLPAELLGGLRRILDDLVGYAKESDTALSPVVRQRLAEQAIELEVLRLLASRPLWLWSRGQHPTYEASQVKVYGCELAQRMSRTALEVLGLYGPLRQGSPAAPLSGRIARQYLRSVSDTIRGGTSEVQRNVVATRGLGLPRG